MVDLTKKEYRDETWFRWQGGADLAKKLNLQYTTPRALRRVGQRNPFAANGGKQAVSQRDAMVKVLRDNLKQSEERNESRGNTQSQIVHLARVRLANFERNNPKEEEI